MSRPTRIVEIVEYTNGAPERRASSNLSSRVVGSVLRGLLGTAAIAVAVCAFAPAAVAQSVVIYGPTIIRVGDAVTYTFDDTIATDHSWSATSDSGEVASSDSPTLTFEPASVGQYRVAATRTVGGEVTTGFITLRVLDATPRLTNFTVTRPVRTNELARIEAHFDYAGEQAIFTRWRAGDGSPSVTNTIPNNASGDTYVSSFAHVYGATGTFDATLRVVVGNEAPIDFVFELAVEQGNGSASDIDTDSDGIPDIVEDFYGMDRYDAADAGLDPDGDGISSLDEINAGTGPFTPNTPTAPAAISPRRNGVSELSPLQLVASPAADPDGDTVAYEFELYRTDGRSRVVERWSNVAADSGSVTATATLSHADGSDYCWRARGADANASGPWMQLTCFELDAVNLPPNPPTLFAPFAVAGVSQPTLTVINPTDPDGDPLSFEFALTGGGLDVNETVPANPSGVTSWQVTQALADNTDYTWTAVAIDDAGNTSTVPAGLQFRLNTSNEAPGPISIITPTDGGRLASTLIGVEVENATDPDGDSLIIQGQAADNALFDNPIAFGTTQSSGRVTPLVFAVPESGTWFIELRASDGAAQGPPSTIQIDVRVDNSAPGQPTIQTPNDELVAQARPTLAIGPAIDPDGDDVSYRFQVGQSATFEQIVDESAPVPDGGSGSVEWSASRPLVNGRYFWRAQGVDDWGLSGVWSDPAPFTVQAGNEPPGAPELVYPGDATTFADTDVVTLSVRAPSDPNEDPVRIHFEVCADDACSEIVERIEDIPADPNTTAGSIRTVLPPGTYTWRSRAKDSLAFGPYSPARQFVIVSERDFLNPDATFDDGGGCTVAAPTTRPVGGGIVGSLVAGLALVGRRRRR